MLCMSPPANVNGAALPVSNKGVRYTQRQSEKKSSSKVTKVPNINLKNLAKADSNKVYETEKANSVLDQMVIPPPSDFK